MMIMTMMMSMNMNMIMMARKLSTNTQLHFQPNDVTYQRAHLGLLILESLPNSPIRNKSKNVWIK